MQATRVASTTSGGGGVGGGVETTVGEDEGLGGEEVFVHRQIILIHYHCQRRSHLSLLSSHQL